MRLASDTDALQYRKIDTDEFSYLSVGLGLAVTQILKGFRSLLLSRACIHLYWPAGLPDTTDSPFRLVGRVTPVRAANFCDQAVTVNGRIMSLSSCSTIWQW